MQDPKQLEPICLEKASWSEAKKDRALLGLLLFLAILIRAWMVYNTEVPARDSIGYIRYALEFEKMGYGEVLNKNHQHPGYPLTILAVSWPVRHFLGATDASTMQLSAQLASSLAGVLLVIPMFFLGKALWDRQIGFWAALLFQVLPVSGQLLSDGLSEPLFLLLSATALLFAVQAVRDFATWRFAVSGAFIGLAYFTRPEAALLLFAIAGTLALMQLLPRWQRPWRRTLRCASCLAVAALVTGSLYFAVTHRFTNKPSVHIIIRGDTSALQKADAGTGAAPRPLLASLFAGFFKPSDTLSEQLVKSVQTLAVELAQGFYFYLWLPALLGLWSHRGTWKQTPAAWVLIGICLLQTLVVLALALKVSYISDRHIMIVVLCGSYVVAAGLLDLGARLATRLGRQRSQIVLALFLGVIASALPKTLQPLHGNRAGHHEAGRWLAEKIRPGDVIIDDHCWAHYYAGQVFLEGIDQKPAAGYLPVRYVVISRSRDPEIAQQRDALEENLRSEHGQIVFHWPRETAADAAKVIVYAVPLSPIGAN
jgi:hypothetical protein